MRVKNSLDPDKKSRGVADEDGYVARRSTHVTGPSVSDGDTWQETLAGRKGNMVVVG